jgi:hypothetical protein
VNGIYLVVFIHRHAAIAACCMTPFPVISPSSLRFSSTKSLMGRSFNSSLVYTPHLQRK